MEDITDERIKYATGEYDVEVVRRLQLRNAGLTRIRGLDRCLQLVSLALPENGISVIQGLENLVALQRLDLSRNRIRVVEGLATLEALEFLDLAGNDIAGIDSVVETLTPNTNLQHVHFRSYDGTATNPCCDEPGYAEKIRRFPKLQVLDGERLVLASERGKLDALLDRIKPDPAFLDSLPPRPWIPENDSKTSVSAHQAKRITDDKLTALKTLCDDLSVAMDEELLKCRRDSSSRVS